MVEHSKEREVTPVMEAVSETESELEEDVKEYRRKLRA
jgi:hypothetical protein